jgi:hypothetical protein
MWNLNPSPILSGILCGCFPFGPTEHIFESIGGLSYNLDAPGTWAESEPASGILLSASLAGLAVLVLKKLFSESQIDGSGGEVLPSFFFCWELHTPPDCP